MQLPAQCWSGSAGHFHAARDATRNLGSRTDSEHSVLTNSHLAVLSLHKLDLTIQRIVAKLAWHCIFVIRY